MTRCYLHIGPSILPRRNGQPLTLDEAMHQAYGHRYAVVYQMRCGTPVPIVADAGSDEVIFVPTGRRLRRDAIDWHAIVSDRELVLAMLGRGATTGQTRARA